MKPVRAVMAALYELPNAPARYAPMEGLRAYAALLIFAVHYFDAYGRLALGVDLNDIRLGSAPSLGSAISYYLFASHYGVDIFFVLSGFLICRMVGRPGFGYRRFILRRVMRIYPAFLVALLIWAWVRIAVQGWYGFDAAQFAGNLLFLNAMPALGVLPYATVTWSLFYEFLFYLIFPLTLLLPGSRHPSMLNVAIVGFVAVAAFEASVGHFAIRFGMLFVGALIGCMQDDQLRRAAARLPTPLVLACYAASTLYFAQLLGYETFIPVFAVTGAMLVLKVMFGSWWLTAAFASTPLRYLGNISYSFYLIHGLAVDIVMTRTLVDALGPLGTLAVTLPLTLLLAVLFASALFLVAERPYFAWHHRPAEVPMSRKAATG